jgi:hypothetical protein
VDPKPPPSPAPPPPPVAPTPALSDLPLSCPVCNEAREEDAQYCQACGHNYTGGPDAAPVPSAGIPSLWLYAIVTFWAVLALLGMYWLYTTLYVL